ncbi:MAG: Rho termination factor N-terminal domain-containing protein, partial [Phycisphaerales bacterium]|nr:Rho termination factor N-terminal domain-containing protein [Phycisphaerales bacterium]
MAKSAHVADDSSSDTPARTTRRRTTKAAEPKGEADTRAATKAEPKPAAKGESRDDKPTPRPVIPAMAPAPRPPQRSEAKPEGRPEGRPEPRPEQRSDGPQQREGREGRDDGPRPDRREGPPQNRPDQRDHRDQRDGRPDNRPDRGADRGPDNRSDRPWSNNPQGDSRLGRRKRKKKRGQGGGFEGGGGGGGGGGQRYLPHGLPSDEELEREAAELERIAANADPAMLKEAISIGELQRMPLEELHEYAAKEGLEDFHALSRQDLIFKVLKARAMKQGLMYGDGTLEIMPDGFGFLRSPEQSYLPGPDDIYVSPSQIRRFGLRRGMEVKGAIRPPKESERYFALLRVEQVNAGEPGRIHDLVPYEELTPLHPEERYILEDEPDGIECRVVDLVTPIGKGQRMLIVAPPRTGKTVQLQNIAHAIETNHPDCYLIVLL